MDGNTIARQTEALDVGSRSPAMVYEATLRRHFPSVIVERVNAAEPGPELQQGRSLVDYDGLVIGGSSLHANDRSPAVLRQIDLVRAFAQTGAPIFGSCWGLQLGVVAAGGGVRRCPNGREIIFARQLSLTSSGVNHPMYEGKPQVFDAPCIHQDEASSLPSQASLLCTNRHSKVQAIAMPLGRSEFWGVQYHPEFDLEHLHDMALLFGELMLQEQFFSNKSQLQNYTNLLAKLAANPANEAVKWQLGINDQITSDDSRSSEVVNWVRMKVLCEH